MDDYMRSSLGYNANLRIQQEHDYNKLANAMQYNAVFESIENLALLVQCHHLQITLRNKSMSTTQFLGLLHDCPPNTATPSNNAPHLVLLKSHFRGTLRHERIQRPIHPRIQRRVPKQ